MKSTECEYYTDQKDKNGDIAINHCCHPNNPSNFEGNCNIEICPYISNIISFPINE